MRVVYNYPDLRVNLKFGYLVLLCKPKSDLKVSGRVGIKREISCIEIF